MSEGERALAGLPALASALLLLSSPAGRSAPQPVPFEGRLPAFRMGQEFAVVGDLQETSLLEFWRESNEAESAALAEGIARLHPAFVVITGDLVFDGSSRRHWARFDRLFAPVRAAGIPVLAAFGNHEYWRGRSGERHLFERFPRLEGRHWYTVSHGPLRLVVLDSNIGVLSRDEWARQFLFYESALLEIDDDPAAKGTLVVLHHPPFTNSTVTGDERHVQRDFVLAFLGARKTMAMLSGHVHAYERFERDRRTFIVSGGGGGPRARLDVSDGRRHRDDKVEGPALRSFHFSVYRIEEGGLHVRVVGLAKMGRSFSTIDQFVLEWP